MDGPQFKYNDACNCNLPIIHASNKRDLDGKIFWWLSTTVYLLFGRLHKKIDNIEYYYVQPAK